MDFNTNPNKFYIDNNASEHRCCWSSAICIDLPDASKYVVLECCEDEAQFIVDTLNRWRY